MGERTGREAVDIDEDEVVVERVGWLPSLSCVDRRRRRLRADDTLLIRLRYSQPTKVIIMIICDYFLRFRGFRGRGGQ